MKTRTFVITNLVGCVVLVICLILQWLLNSSLHRDLQAAYQELNKVQDESDAKGLRLDSLERDTTDLKQKLESVNHEVIALQDELDNKTEQTQHQTADLDAAKKSLEEWQAGIAARDQRIAEMDKAIDQYKARLDEAVAQLKKVAAQRKAAAQ